MNVKGQGALEYLLLIGGAVLVAAIVIALVTGIPTNVTNPQVAASCAAQFNCTECITNTVTGVAGTPCKASFTNGTSADTAAQCTAAAALTFQACVPD
jgi:uncharacterized protein (UPF0333 family)